MSRPSSAPAPGANRAIARKIKENAKAHEKTGPHPGRAARLGVKGGLGMFKGGLNMGKILTLISPKDKKEGFPWLGRQLFLPRGGKCRVKRLKITCGGILLLFI
jgi:hypothetical protein